MFTNNFHASNIRYPPVGMVILPETAKKMVNRERRLNRPRIPHDFAELAAMRHIFSPSIFLGDVIGTDGSSAVIFSTPELLQKLAHVDEVHIDGTFKVNILLYIEALDPLVHLYIYL